MPKSKRTPWSLHWLTLAVVLPLLVLIVLAFVGLDAQAKAAWVAKQEEADRAAKAAAELLAREFTSREVRFQRFPDPPVPGNASPLDDVLAGNDLQALEEVSKSPDAGNSPAGLPRRALAALRLMKVDPGRTGRDEAEGRRIARILIDECPSVLTARAVEQELGWNFSPETERWEEQLGVIRQLERQPAGGWIWGKADRLTWIQPADDHILWAACSSNDLGPLLHSVTPPGFQMRPVTAPFPVGQPFASAAVAFGDGLRVEVYPTDHQGLSAGIRRQQVWTFSLLAFASAVSLFGLFFLHRTLRRERQLGEMKDQFVASVSHELRAPVASIRLMADALEAEKVAPATAKEFHRLIAREGARLSTLVGNVLDHARIEQGRKVWKMEPCDLSSLIADTLRVMEPLAREKDITLQSDLAAVEASADADAIQQAVVNLLDNAIKFSPAGSTITTTLASDDERRTWTLAVQDQGPGIPKHEQDRIFERFYRPGDELRRETQGTGIGLSLVKAIAEAHGGRVTVESEPGKGSAFVLRGSAGLQTGPDGSSCRSEDRRSLEET